MTKTCTKCGEDKPLELFYSHKKGKFGKRASCKTCYNAGVTGWKSRNVEKTKGYTETWRSVNRERYNKTHADWSALNRDKRNSKEAIRRAAKLKATPPWVTQEHKTEMLSVYSLARECEMLTGDSYHVDHIVPLKGHNVCGLHVPWNLQVLPADLNLKKSNSFPQG